MAVSSPLCASLLTCFPRQKVPSVAHAVVNFLTALSVAEGGVREIMPFVRYISQFIDTEYNMIKQQDQGQGVVCAATWYVHPPGPARLDV